MLPLIDIVFLLLVFFIYAMLSMAVHRGMRLDLPQSSQALPSEEAPLSISIKKAASGIELYFDKDLVTQEELAVRLKAGKLEDTKRIFVFGDADISYQQLYGVLDLLTENGVEDISLEAVAK